MKTFSNPPYVNRRTALLNMKRVRLAACMTAVSSAAIAALVLVNMNL